jgi:hypothetical protein
LLVEEEVSLEELSPWVEAVVLERLQLEDLELQTLVVVPGEVVLVHWAEPVVLESSLFNIQNKEVKYGTFCTNWLQ